MLAAKATRSRTDDGPQATSKRAKTLLDSTIDVTDEDPLPPPLSLVKANSVKKVTPKPKKATKKDQSLLESDSDYEDEKPAKKEKKAAPAATPGALSADQLRAVRLKRCT
jgi:hypothetical protein